MAVIDFGQMPQPKRSPFAPKPLGPSAPGADAQAVPTPMAPPPKLTPQQVRGLAAGAPAKRLPPSSTGPQTRKTDGSTKKQRIIDTFPSFDELKQAFDDEGEWPDDPAQQQKIAQLYHQKVTMRSTRYKAAPPDQRAMMDARIRQVTQGETFNPPAAPDNITDSRPDASGSSFGNTMANIVNQSPPGQIATAITGKTPYQTRPAEGAVERIGETAGNIVTTLAGFALPGGLAAKAAARFGPLAAATAFGTAGGAATSIPRNAAALRTGEIDPNTGEPITGGRAAANIGLDTLTGAVMGPIAQVIPGATAARTIGRNLAQTGAGALGELSKGNMPTAGTTLTDFGTGLALDFLTPGAAHGPRIARGREVDLPPDVVPLALPPATNMRPKGDARFNEAPIDVDAIRTDRRVAAGRLLPEPATDYANPGTVYAGTRQISEGDTVFAGPAARPAKAETRRPDLAAERARRIAGLEGAVERLQVGLRSRKPKERAKIQERLGKVQAELDYLRQEALRVNPPPYTPDSSGVTRSIEADTNAAQQRLRQAEAVLTGAHEEGVETYSGGRSILTWKPERLRMMSDSQLRELTLDMADTDNSNAFRSAVAEYVDARSELRRLRAPEVASERAGDLNEMDAAMRSMTVREGEIDTSSGPRSGVTPDDATVANSSDLTTAASQYKLHVRDLEALKEKIKAGLITKEQGRAEVAAMIERGKQIKGDVAGQLRQEGARRSKQLEMAKPYFDEQAASPGFDPHTEALYGDPMARPYPNEQEAKYTDDDIPDFDDPRFAAQGGFVSPQAMIGLPGRIFDEAIMAPLRAMGAIDSQGRFIPGNKAADWVRQQIMHVHDEGTANDPNRIAKLANTVKAGLVDKFGLPEQYLAARRQKDRTENQVRQQGLDLYRRELENLPPAEQRAVYQLLTDENAPDGLYQSLRQEVRDFVDGLGQRMVDSGQISAESFARNKGEYLSRSYQEHEFKRSKLSKGFETLGRKVRFKAGQLKGRGDFINVDAERLAKMQPTGRNAKTGKPTYTINGHEYELTGRAGNRSELRRDWTKAEREQMGEVEDAAYAFLKTIDQSAQNVASGEFFKQIADDPSIAAKPEDQAEVRDLEAMGWRQIDPGNMAGTGGKKKFGALAGYYVEPNVHRDLTEIAKMQDRSAWGSFLTQWKMNKTARNPVAHMNNIVSNFGALELNGGNIDNILPAGLVYFGRGDADWQKALQQGREDGIFDSGVSRELTQERGKLLDAHDPRIKPRNVLEHAASFMGLLKKLDQKMLDAYGAEDEIFRLALYKSSLDKGMSRADAANAAITGFIDYNITAPWINAARRSVLPFIAYSYRAYPMMARAAAERPWKVAKIATALAVLNKLGSRIAGGNEEEERTAMDKSMGAVGKLAARAGVYTDIRLPGKDSLGQQRYLDTRRFIPGGDVMNVNEKGAIPVMEALSMGGPLVQAGELALNRQGFNDKQIRNPSLPWDKQVGQVADYLYKGYMPNNPLVPGSYSQSKIIDAATGKPDAYGRMNPLPEAMLSTVGIKTNPVNVNEQIEKRAGKARRDIQAYGQVIREAARKRGNGNLSDEEFAQIRQEQMALIEAAQKELQAYQQRVAEAGGKNMLAKP